MLFREMLDHINDDTCSVILSCEIDLDKPSKDPEPLVTINDVKIVMPGNLISVIGSKGSANSYN
jgi:hypothetical protein